MSKIAQETPPRASPAYLQAEARRVLHTPDELLSCVEEPVRAWARREGGELGERFTLRHTHTASVPASKRAHTQAHVCTHAHAREHIEVRENIWEKWTFWQPGQARRPSHPFLQTGPGPFLAPQDSAHQGISSTLQYECQDFALVFLPPQSTHQDQGAGGPALCACRVG